MKMRIVKYGTAVAAMLALCIAVSAQEPNPRRGRMGAGAYEFAKIVEGFGGPVVKGAPFSARVTRETLQTLADGNRIARKETANIARDSLGRTRREVGLEAIGPLNASGEAPHVVLIRDAVAGKIYVLNEDKKTVTAIDSSRWGNEERRGERMPRMAEHDNANIQKESLGTKSEDGLTVDGTRWTRTIPTGKIGNARPITITFEEWYSLELQMVVSSTRTDPRFGTTTYQLTNINRNEPSQSLFTVPGDYAPAPERSMWRRNRNAPSQNDN